MLSTYLDIIQKAYKTELNPNNKQRSFFNRCAGISRYVYNWALADRIAHYESGEPTTHSKQKKRFIGAGQMPGFLKSS